MNHLKSLTIFVFAVLFIPLIYGCDGPLKSSPKNPQITPIFDVRGVLKNDLGLEHCDVIHFLRWDEDMGKFKDIYRIVPLEPGKNCDHLKEASHSLPSNP